jgi:hypothetical protein
VLRGPEGLEDLVDLGDGLVVGSEYQYARREFGPVAPPPADGALWLLRLPAATLARLALEGFPAAVSFHPHGLALVRGGAQLAVLNHAGERGGERIELFDVLRSAPTGPGSALRLRHAGAVLLPAALAADGANEVAGAGADLYVTQFRGLPAALRRWAAAAEPRAWPRAVHAALETLAALAGLPLTRIYRCPLPDRETGAGGGPCVATGPAGVAWNGLQVLGGGGDDGDATLVASDLFDSDPRGGVHVLHRDPASGELTAAGRLPAHRVRAVED